MQENGKEQAQKNPGNSKNPRVVEVSSDPYGVRTHVAAVKGRCPRPLDEGAMIGRSTIDQLQVIF
jgi:hypothetical protein